MYCLLVLLSLVAWLLREKKNWILKVTFVLSNIHYRVYNTDPQHIILVMGFICSLCLHGKQLYGSVKLDLTGRLTDKI